MDDDQRVGILVSKGMRMVIPPGGLTVEVSPDGSTTGTLHLNLAVDVAPLWLRAGLDHVVAAEALQGELRQAAEAANDQAIVDTLERESLAGMQAAVAAGAALDSLYASIKDRIELPPELIEKWRERRTARSKQITEVIRRGIALRQHNVPWLSSTVKEIMKWRGLAIHPPSEPQPTPVHPVIARGVEWRFDAFRYENARTMVGAAISIVAQVSRWPLVDDQKVKVLLRNLQESCQPVLEQFETRYGPLFERVPGEEC